MNSQYRINNSEKSSMLLFVHKELLLLWQVVVSARVTVVQAGACYLFQKTDSVCWLFCLEVKMIF